MVSKTQIDKAGRYLSDPNREYDETALELDYVFEDYRKSFLLPLTNATLDIQSQLESLGKNYYIAQRLKRKPQILKKLGRLSVRLTQLQDIGGLRIITNSNSESDEVLELINTLSNGRDLRIDRIVDYRTAGRDDSGYRAIHVIVEMGGRFIEIQIRNTIQHFWAEVIERTSIYYGYSLKEQEGDKSVLEYFKRLSDVLTYLDSGGTVTVAEKMDLENNRQKAEEIIRKTGRVGIINGRVNEDVILSLAEKEKRHPNTINNWIIVFDWNHGNFVTWDTVSLDLDEAIKAYTRYELDYKPEDGFEVVMIGSSDVKIIRETHSHYFGVEGSNVGLENLNSIIIGLSEDHGLDLGAIQILSVLFRKKHIGGNSISSDTIKNHFCKNVMSADSSLESLIKKNFLIVKQKDGHSLSINPSKLNEVQKLIS